jgi:rRNA maturation RNase YbeY
VILIKHCRNWGLDEGVVRKAALDALKSFGYSGEEVELSVCFVGKTRAQKLNQRYRKMNYVPQVLGFPMSKEADSDGLVHLGDVVICTSKLKYEASFLKKERNEVVKEWMVHGVKNLVK